MIDQLEELFSRMNWRVVAIVIAVVVVVSIVFGFAACSGSDQADQAAPVQLDEQPRQLQWVSFQGVEVPVAEQGPHSRTEPAPTGYDQSPVGAALAAIQATIRMSVANDTQFPKVSSTLLAPGEGRDWFIANRLRVSTTDPIASKDAPHVLAYQVTSFKKDSATVDIFTRYPDQSVTVNHTTVAWQAGGDWGLVVPVPSKMTGAAVESVKGAPKEAVVLRPTS